MYIRKKCKHIHVYPTDIGMDMIGLLGFLSYYYIESMDAFHAELGVWSYFIQGVIGSWLITMNGYERV